MLAFKDYEAANAWGKQQGHEGGGGLSKQAISIMPKIKEIDAVMTPQLQSIISEAHPELAFTRLNQGIPCAHNKRHKDGIAQRCALLKGHGLPDPKELHQTLKDTHKTYTHKSGAKKHSATLDDVIDAMALALTARAKRSAPYRRHPRPTRIVTRNLGLETVSISFVTLFTSPDIDFTIFTLQVFS